MATLLVTIAGPQRRADLSIPAEAPIAELIPELVELCVGPAGRDPAARWAIGPPGSPPFPPDRALGDLGVLDGAILELRDIAAETRTGGLSASADPPADRRERRSGRWRQDRLARVTRLTEELVGDIGLLLAGEEPDLSCASPAVAAQLRAMAAPFLASGDGMLPDFGDLRLAVRWGADAAAGIEATATFVDRSTPATRTRSRPRQVTLCLGCDPEARRIISATVTSDDSDLG